MRPPVRAPEAMTLRAVLFDVGDTLLRENPSRFELYARAARERGLELDAEGMRRRMLAAHHALPRVLDGAYRYSDPWFRAFIARVFGPGEDRAGSVIEGRALEALTEELFERFEDPATFEVHAGARELLDELRGRGLRLGVVSNWSARLPRVLAVLGLAERLDFVLCSALEELEKPDPELFRRALARADVAADQALHVGDHPEKDVAGARAAGLLAVRIDHAVRARHDPPGRPSAEEGPVVTSFRELRSLILGRL